MASQVDLPHAVPKDEPSYATSDFSKLYLLIEGLQPVNFAQDLFLMDAVEHMGTANKSRMGLVEAVMNHNKKVSGFVDWENEITKMVRGEGFSDQTQFAGAADVYSLKPLMKSMQEEAIKNKQLRLEIKQSEGMFYIMGGEQPFAWSRNEAKLNRLLFKLERVAEEYPKKYVPLLLELAEIDSALLRFRQNIQAINSAIEIGTLTGECHFERRIWGKE